MDEFNLVAGAASIISLFVTIWVARQVSLLRANFILRVRLPVLVSRLNELTDWLGEDLDDFERNRAAISERAALVCTTVDSIVKKLSKPDRQRMSSMAVEFDKLSKKATSEAVARKIRLESRKFAEVLGDVRETLEWQG